MHSYIGCSPNYISRGWAEIGKYDVFYKIQL